MSSQAEPRQSRGAIALVVAWAVVLLAVGGAAVYLFLQSPEEVAPAPSAAMVLELQPVQVPLASEEETAAEERQGDNAAGASEPQAEAEDARTAESQAPVEEPLTASEEAQSEAADPLAEPPVDGTEQGQSPESQPDVGQGETRSDQTSSGGIDRQQQAATQEAALPIGGEEPWRLYAADFDQSQSGPRIGVVLFGLGLSAAATETAIKQLPPEVTLSFSPYARLLEQWIALARANNHEVMLDLPLEPLTFPEDDPGPHALLTVLDEEQNEKRLDWLLRRATSYVGVAAVMGSRFVASDEHMRPLLQSLKERGLLFLDNGASEQSAAAGLAEKLDVPFVANDRTLDAAQASRVAINARLSEIERIARENGFAVAMAQPYPVTIERLRDWTLDLESRGFVLAPVTALAEAR